MAEKKKNISLDNLEKFKENLDKDISKHKVLTQAEYDALTEVEKNNGTFYFIEDGNSAVTDSDKDYIDSQDQQILNSAKAFTTDTIQNYYAKTEVDTLLNTKADMEEATSTKAGMFSSTNKVKLDGIEDGAQVNTVTGIKGSTETTYRTGEVNITAENIGLGNVENKSSETIRGEITKSNVTDALGFTPPTVEEALTSAKGYTDTKIADLINGAPTTLDTLGEIAQAMSDNKGVVDALDEAIGTKATASDLTAHTGNTANPHGVTKAQVGLGNVENKSSATIRGELTKSDVTTALGFTPPESDTTYTNATTTKDGLLSKSDKTKLDSLSLPVLKWKCKNTVPVGTGNTSGNSITFDNISSPCFLLLTGAYSVLYYINFAYETRIQVIAGDSNIFSVNRSGSASFSISTKVLYNHDAYIIDIATNNCPD